MKISNDGIGVVIEFEDIIRRYCNFTEAEALADFKWFLYTSGRSKVSPIG